MNIYLDIETKATSRSDIRERVTSKVAPPANYKKADTIAQWWASEGESAKSQAIAQTALDGTWGEIACIGWAVGDDPVIVSVGATEAQTIGGWGSALADHIGRTQQVSQSWWVHATWIGHNVQDFDLRFLWQRSIVLGVDLPFAIPTDRYPKGPWVYDTMKEWSGFGKYVKQADLELAFGLQRNDPLASGADVATASLADITAHCMEDVRLVREIHKRMTR